MACWKKFRSGGVGWRHSNFSENSPQNKLSGDSGRVLSVCPPRSWFNSDSDFENFCSVNEATVKVEPKSTSLLVSRADSDTDRPLNSDEGIDSPLVSNRVADLTKSFEDNQVNQRSEQLQRQVSSMDCNENFDPKNSVRNKIHGLSNFDDSGLDITLTDDNASIDNSFDMNFSKLSNFKHNSSDVKPKLLDLPMKPSSSYGEESFWDKYSLPNLKRPLNKILDSDEDLPVLKKIKSENEEKFKLQRLPFKEIDNYLGEEDVPLKKFESKKELFKKMFNFSSDEDEPKKKRHKKMFDSSDDENNPKFQPKREKEQSPYVYNDTLKYGSDNDTAVDDSDNDTAAESLHSWDEEDEQLFYDSHADSMIDMNNEINENITNAQLPSHDEELNFDFNSISRNPTANFRRADLGNKALETLHSQQLVTEGCLKNLFDAIDKRPRDVIEPDPVGLRVSLMQHQKEALTWMKWMEKQKSAGGILADEMGLGKTLQMIALVLSAKNDRKAVERAAETSDESDDDIYGFNVNNKYCRKSRKIYDGRTLVVCPKSLISQWEKEILNRVEPKKLKVFVYHSDNKFKNQDESKLSKYDIVLTTYGTVVQEKKLNDAPKKNKDSRLFRIHWERVILDEAHIIRNIKTGLSIAVTELRMKARWCVTGTPVQNKEKDIYAILKFLKLKPFDDWRVWKRWVSNNNSEGNKRLMVIMKSIMLRRTKAELTSKGIIEKMPEKSYEEIFIQMDSAERLVYQRFLLFSRTYFEEFLRRRMEKENKKNDIGFHRRRDSIITNEIPDKLSKRMKILMKTHDNDQHAMNTILVLILRLRQLCCHPGLVKSMLSTIKSDPEENDLENFGKLEDRILNELDQLLTDDEDDDDIDETKAKQILCRSNPVFYDSRKSSKVKVLLEKIELILDRGEKVIIVSQWTGFLDVVARSLKNVSGATCATFSGKTSTKDRSDIIDRINDPNDKLNILLLSLTAGGIGINLMGATNLMLIDLHWNPQWEKQAQDRIHRLGQRKDVKIYKFICEDSIEENIKTLQEMKLKIAERVLCGSNEGNKLTIDDLKILFALTKNPNQQNGVPQPQNNEVNDKNRDGN